MPVGSDRWGGKKNERKKTNFSARGRMKIVPQILSTVSYTPTIQGICSETQYYLEYF